MKDLFIEETKITKDTSTNILALERDVILFYFRVRVQKIETYIYIY